MSGYNFDRLKVLVVDDNQHMRDLVGAILQGLGTKTVYKAASGEDAWNLLLNHPCDLIFVDWVMDGMTGLDLTLKIRTAPDTPNAFIPIVLLTGHTSIERIHMARDAGVNEILAKPVSARAIISRLISVIEHPRAFVRTKTYFGPCRRRRRDSDYGGPKRRLDEHAQDENTQTSANAA